MITSWKKTLIGASLLITSLQTSYAETSKEQLSELNKTYGELALFGQVFEHIRENYVESTSDEELIKSAINGMLRSLDPHSNFLTGEEATAMQEQTSGTYGGLGLQVSQDENGMVLVIAPFDDTPAAKAGIQPGDKISHVDGVAITGEGLDKATEKMKGAPETSVTLTIVREGVESFDVDVKRAIIRPNPVRWRLEGQNGYIRLATFNQRSTEVLLEAVNDLNKQAKKKNFEINGFIIDLRSNPGGLLDQAISVVDSFIDEGEIVSIRGRDASKGERFTATPGDIIDGKPLIVLIDAGSASASEIVAGALQDLDRAIILGERSFGKGSVQTVGQVSSDGDLVRMTTARYFTPSGRSIQGEGIHPDIEVKPAKIEILERKITREGDITGALSNPGVGYPNDKTKTTTEDKEIKPTSDNQLKDPEKNKNLAETIKDALTTNDKKAQSKGNRISEDLIQKEADASKKDNQLQRALDLLEGISVYEQFQNGKQ